MIDLECVEFVFLHGHDSRPGAMLSLVEQLTGEFPSVVMRLLAGPVVLATSGGYAWFDETDATFPDPTSAVRWLTKQLTPQLSKRFLLIGFSQGAAVALSAAFAGVSNIAGVVSIAGFMPDDVLVAEFGGQLLLLHGEDDEVVDLMYAQRLARQATAIGIDATLKVNSGGHHISSDGGQQIANWLRGQPPTEQPPTRPA